VSDGEEWRGKGLRVRWIDGSVTDFPALSSEHWNRLLAFYDRGVVKQRTVKGR
jgi:hypothetical protein